MSAKNTHDRYGSVTKTFHWLTALLILTLIPLGFIADNLPYGSGDELAQKVWFFSLHKTLGVTLFFVALARILWAVTQKHPAPLHPERRVETWAAQTAHWLLYGTLVLVPLSGWVHHAAETGFAPIWWPFGQTLPFVPQSLMLSQIASGLHKVFNFVLIFTLLAHIAGALKHVVLDRDQTLARMLPGTAKGAVSKVTGTEDTVPEGTAHAPRNSGLPALSALAIFLAAVGIGGTLGVFAAPQTETAAHQPSTAETPQAHPTSLQSPWRVDSGTLSIGVTQMGSKVTGTFADWSATIAFDENAQDAKHGHVEVTIATGSLTLGSVSGQATGPDFLDAEAFPTAIFSADILAAPDATATATDGPETPYVAQGSLTMKGIEMPLDLPFTLSLDGDTAQMTGQTILNRTDFNVGETYPDESSVGFTVPITVTLTATRVAE